MTAARRREAQGSEPQGSEPHAESGGARAAGWWSGGRGRAARLVPFACPYVSFAAMLGFLAAGAPVVLRERGAGLAEVGLLQLITLPLGLTFLWAPLVDRVRLPGLPHRVGWIAATQLGGIALLLLLAAGEAWPAAALFAIAVAVSLVFATTDVALEALVVDTVPAVHRPAVTTAKLCGSSIGGMLGTGLLAMTYHALGWRGSFGALAVLAALCLLPVLRYPEAAGAAPVAQRARPTARLRYALLLGLYFGASGLFLASDSLVLVDLRVPLAAVGFVGGTLGPAINLAATMAAGALMAAVPTERLMAALALAAAASGGGLVAATLLGSAWLGVASTVLGTLAASGAGVPVFTAIYRWAQGSAAATDYSLLFGVGFLAALPARVGGPALAGWLGWPAFFAAATPAYLAALWLIGRAMARTERRDGGEAA